MKTNMLMRQKSTAFRPISVPTCFMFLLFFLGSLLLFLITPKTWMSRVERETYLKFVEGVPPPSPLPTSPPPQLPPNNPKPNHPLPNIKLKPNSKFNSSNPIHKPRVVNFNCTSREPCKARKNLSKKTLEPNPNKCPDFFMFIHEDLRPWKETGITLEMVEMANRTANFRLTIVDGRMYIKINQKSFQTRDVFTIWGFIQLMELYPGILPDVDLMFDCVDWPVIDKKYYESSSLPPPPLFRYCSDNEHLDIPLPDWSFWGWAEVNTKPWEHLVKDISKGNKRINWEKRVPAAYWKGNPSVADVRKELMQCNASHGQDWNARLYIQDWIRESEQGYKQSNLANQCDHRYKIYVEGSAWSVSLKNIMACDSPTLIVTPKYYDFFSRALMPGRHYWPIQLDKKCESIKFAVDWGNQHTKLAKAMGRAGSNFMKEDLKISNVYDYMFHMLDRYSKLMKYKPPVPEGAKEVCSDSEYCSGERSRVEKRFMFQSATEGPNSIAPCQLDPSPDGQRLDQWNKMRAKALRKVAKMEEESWSKEKAAV